MDNGMNGLIDFEQILANTHYIDTTEEKLRKLEITGVNMAEDLRKEFDSARESFSALASEFKKAPSADLGKQLAPVVDTLNRIMKATEGLITQYIELNKVLTETSVNTKETFKSLPQHTQDLVKSLQKAVNVFYKLNDEQRESAKAMMQQLQATDLTDEAIKKLYTDAEHMLTFLDEVQNGAKKTGEIIDELTGEVYKNGESWRRLTEYSDIAADSYNGFSLTLNNLINTWKSYSEEERKVFGPSTLKDIELQAEKLRELDAELRKALNPKYGIKTSIAEQLAKNIELIEEYRSRIADLDRAVKVAENIPQNERTGYLEQLRNDLANASNAQEEYRVSTEKLLQIDNLASMSIKELETRVSALQQAYTLLKDTGRADFAYQIADATKQANEVLRGLKAEMDSIFKPQAAEGSIDWWRQKISELKKEIKAMPEISPVKVQELHEAEDALNNLTESLKRQKEEVSELERMRDRLAKVQERTRLMATDEYKDLQKALTAEKQKQHIEELSLALDNAKVGSLEAMQAQYNIYIAKLKSLTREEQNRAGVEVEVYTKDGMVAMSTERLAIETADLYNNMKVLNESFGKHNMNVGNYARTFDGLTFSIVQVVRELPAAAINMNTFFLAISNNIPMVIDEIQRVQALAKAEKKEVPSAIKVITGAMKTGVFWLNVFVAIMGLLLSKSDKVIAKLKDWRDAIKGLTDTEKALKAINEQFKSGGKELGKAYTSFYMLREEYKNLRTEAEKQTWIKNHKNDFHELGVSVTELKDAEVLFVDKSDQFVKALMKQAMATAALKAAQDKIEKSFDDFMKAELSKERMKDLLKRGGYASDVLLESDSMFDYVSEYFYDKAGEVIDNYYKGIDDAQKAAGTRTPIFLKNMMAPADVKVALKIRKEYETSEKYLKKVKDSESDITNIMENAANFANSFNANLDDMSILAAGLEETSNKTKEHVRDIGKYIDDTYLKVKKLRNDIFEEGQEDELQKRTDETINKYKERSIEFNNILAQNRRMLAKSTKALTEDQRKKLEDMNDDIKAAWDKLSDNFLRQTELIAIDRKIREQSRKEKRTSADLEATRGDIEKKYAYRRQIINKYKERSIEFNNILAQNRRMLAKSTKALTEDQRKKLEDMNDDIKAAWDKLSDNFLRQTELIAIDRKIREQSRKEKRTSADLEATRGDIEKEYAYRRQIIKIEMQKELLENSKLLKEDQVSEESIRLKYFYKQIELDKKYADEVLAIRKNMNDAILLNVSEFSKQAYKANLDNINIAFTQEANRILAEGGIAYKDVMDEYAEINSEAGTNAALAFFNSYIDSLEDPGLKMKLMKALAEYQKNVNDFAISDADKKRRLRHELELSKLPEGNSLARDILTAQHELEDLQAKLDAWRKGSIKLSDEEVQTILNNIDKVQDRLGKLRLGAFSQYGLPGGLLANIAPGFFGGDQLNALEQAKQTIINSLNEILQSEIEIREREKELAEDRVNEAQSAYEREIEARNNGYAHSVNTAKKELLLQQKTLRKKQAELEKAERAKAAVDSLSQASSLTTAVAGFWQAFAPLGPWGILAAALATAGMFTAFVASKAKAAQLTSTYGEGGLEFLEGGSHASGNDIDLHTKNSRGRNMRAEGGEALAIINKRSTAKYRSILPGLIASLNDGTFLNKYSASINAVQQTVGNNVDLYNIESSLGTLVRQGRNQVYELGDATVIMRGNTRTVIRHQR